MQKSPNKDDAAKKIGLYVMGYYKWGCRCCGPKDGKERQIEHQAVRSILKQEDIDYILFGEGEEDN